MRAVAPVTAVLWALLCLRWFDVAAPWRPPALAAVPPALLAALVVTGLGILLRRHAGTLAPLAAGVRARDLGLMVLLAVAFRLPLAWTAAAGYTSADGSLSGIVALRAHEGRAHYVFVPNVPYSGSLKSHLAAALAWGLDLQRAFTLSSVLFYALFVAAVFGLGAAVGRNQGPQLAVGRLAALYCVFAPAFVTRYSLSNDGNYVEVLGLGTYALLLAARSLEADDADRHVLAWAAGVLLGLAFWCHILAVIPAAVVGLVIALGAPRRLPAMAGRLLGGFALGDLPALLWNLGNGGESFRYIVPGGQPVGALAEGPGWTARALGIATDHLPVLAGYDIGYRGLMATAHLAFALLALAAIVYGYGLAIRRFRAERDAVRGTLLLFTAVNLAVAVAALPYIPGNARYLQFLMAPFAVVLAEAFAAGGRRFVLGFLVAMGAVSSLWQWPAEAASDRKWRDFSADLRRAGVERCYTDFYLSAKINFVSEEQVVCSSELGPTTTEYFADYRATLAADGPPPALVAVNRTAADKLERKLRRIGVPYKRLDLMKPVLIPARRVRPEELFAATATTDE